VKRILTFGLALVAALSALSASAWGAEATDVSLTPTGGVSFPNRAYILTVPDGAKVAPDSVRVEEDGSPVSELSVIPAEAADQNRFAIALVLDASQSMRGAPIGAAMEAARALADERNQGQELSLVTFNRTTEVGLPFTSDPVRIDGALDAEPPLAAGTYLYDGVARALDLFKTRNLSGGAIVVLSDGADTGSIVDADSAAEAAKQAHVRVFTVGLRSRAFRIEPLKSLADDTGGTYFGAQRVDDLTPIFAQLGQRLSGELLLRYRSLAGPGDAVRVKVSAPGLSDTAEDRYVTPELEAKPLPPFHPSLGYRFWRSPAALLAAVLIPAALAAAALILLLRPRGRSLRTRMSQFVASAPPKPAKDTQAVAAKVFAGTEKGLERTRWWTRFKEDVELADIRMPAVHIVLWTLVATVVVLWILVSLFGSPLAAVLALFVPFATRAEVHRRIDRKRRLFAEQLPDNLQVLASALRAGHSLVGALSAVVDDASEPSQTEFRRVVADEQLGVPLEDALLVVAERMASRELEQVALVAALQRETGGNSAEVLDRVAETVRERAELRRLVKTLTAQGRLARWIVSLLPVGLLVVLTLLDGEYMAPLYETGTGRFMLGFAAVMVITGSLVIRRIVDIKI